MTPLPPCSTLFPYTTLFRSVEFSARARAVTLLERTERAGTGRVGLTEARTVVVGGRGTDGDRSEEHTSELQSRGHLVCRLLLEKKKDVMTNKNVGETIH